MIEVKDLQIGLVVISNREFSGVPAGTKGRVISAPDRPSVAVQWNRYPNDKLVDWFSFDELQYLDVVIAPGLGPIVKDEKALILDILSGNLCPHCNGRKRVMHAFCYNDYLRLPGSLARAVGRYFDDRFVRDFQAAAEFLKSKDAGENNENS